jgi:uncharacterized membrane protein
MTYDPGYSPVPASNYPVQLDIVRAESQSRLLAFFSIFFFLGRYILAIPVLIVLYFVAIAALVVAWIAQWAILFTGHYPVGMHKFVTGYLRWMTRLQAYIFGLTDKYPPFRLDP